MDPLRIVVRAVFGYAVALAFVRIAGNRDVKQADVHTFVVALIMGDLFDDLLWLEVHASQFVVALSSLFLVHAVASRLWYRSGRRTWSAGTRAPGSGLLIE